MVRVVVRSVARFLVQQGMTVFSMRIETQPNSSAADQYKAAKELAFACLHGIYGVQKMDCGVDTGLPALLWASISKQRICCQPSKKVAIRQFLCAVTD
jgi:hypothetical protein